jgi:hypothetical protein
MHIFAILILLSLSVSHCIAYQIRGEQPQNSIIRRGDLGADKTRRTSKQTVRTGGRKRKADTKGDPPATSGHEVKSGRIRKKPRIDSIHPHPEQQPTIAEGNGKPALNPDLSSQQEKVLTIAERRGRPKLTQNLGDLNRTCIAYTCFRALCSAIADLSRFKDPVHPERTGNGARSESGTGAGLKS